MSKIRLTYEEVPPWLLANLRNMSIQMVVNRSGFGKTTVYKEIAAGRLVVTKCGRRSVVTPENYGAWQALLAEESKAKRKGGVK